MMNCTSKIDTSTTAAAAWTALNRIARPSQAGARYPAAAFELASALACEPTPKRRERKPPLFAGTVVEVLRPEGRGAPRLELAPGAIPGLDRSGADVRVFRSLEAGRVEGWVVPAGASVLVRDGSPEEGDLLVVRSRGCLRLAIAGMGGAPISLADAQPVGIVEGIISSSAC